MSSAVREVAMAYEKDRESTTSRRHSNKTRRRVGFLIFGVFCGLLLVHCWDNYHNADMFGRQSSSLSLLTGLLSFSGKALAQKCQTQSLTSSPPSNASVALQSYSYCGGTLKVGVCTLCPVIVDYWTDRTRHLSKISRSTR